jgi:hypothetical protein
MFEGKGSPDCVGLRKNEFKVGSTQSAVGSRIMVATFFMLSNFFFDARWCTQNWLSPKLPGRLTADCP